MCPRYLPVLFKDILSCLKGLSLVSVIRVVQRELHERHNLSPKTRGWILMLNPCFANRYINWNMIFCGLEQYNTYIKRCTYSNLLPFRTFELYVLPWNGVDFITNRPTHYPTSNQYTSISIAYIQSLKFNVSRIYRSYQNRLNACWS